ncbi:MAG: Mut7-C ubiquitin/RNAse domain-containing protein [Anaerolineae bacterium]|nr:Mut7-C ubiquitin/RNAse domain-containing protein [Anaerolineae bacterium]
MNAHFRFYAELNEFLPHDKRFQPVTISFKGRQSVKHLIESLGVPHTEVDLVLINGHPVDFRYLVQDGDRVAVYPVFECMDITPLLKLRPEALREPRFVLDGHLGRLAAYLRMLGFDTLYRNDYEDEKLAEISAGENRILLTRDRGLLKRKMVTHGFCLLTKDPRQQLLEVIKRFDLQSCFKPFARCIACNGILRKVEKADILDQLEPGTRRYFNDFSRCNSCGKIYWKGSHHDRMLSLVTWVNESLNRKLPESDVKNICKKNEK